MSRDAVDRMTRRLVNSGIKPEKARSIAVSEAKKHDRKQNRPVEINSKVRK